MKNDFFSGINCFLRGFRLVLQPGIRRFILLPLTINTLVFTAAVWLGIEQFDNLLEWLFPAGNSFWVKFAHAAIWVIFTGVVLIVLLYTFTLLANLLGAPFNGLLSEKIEHYLSGNPVQDQGGFRNFISTILPSLASELRKFTYFLFLGILVFLLSLIPVLNIISPFLWVIFSSWVLALEYISYPMENNRIYFSQVRLRIREKKILSLGFGLAVMITTLIPLINFMVMPAAVAGATVMWTKHFDHLIPDKASENGAVPA